MMNTLSKPLRGIAWNHSRAFPPLVAVAQRYEELHPDVRIVWEKRSLHEFGHEPICDLAKKYDLVIIDHPWAGQAFADELIVDLRQYVDAELFDELENSYVGRSFESYVYDGKLLALPIDAATPVPSWREDLVAAADAVPPTSWQELLELARSGLAVMPGFHADLFLAFLMLCYSLDRPYTGESDQLAETNSALESLERLRELASYMSPEIFSWNPIDLAEAMTRRSDIAYCAFAYSYNNYSRAGFATHSLRYGNLVELEPGQPLRSILGGTGIAISAFCQDLLTACRFASFVAGADVQKGIYFSAGGQPAHRVAWDCSACNTAAGGFFTDTRESHENAVTRPRYAGYVQLQEDAGLIIQEYLKQGGSVQKTWDRIRTLYEASLAAARSIHTN